MDDFVRARASDHGVSGARSVGSPAEGALAPCRSRVAPHSPAARPAAAPRPLAWRERRASAPVRGFRLAARHRVPASIAAAAAPSVRGRWRSGRTIAPAQSAYLCEKVEGLHTARASVQRARAARACAAPPRLCATPCVLPPLAARDVRLHRRGPRLVA